jgi:hypothetical protein
LGVIFIKGKLSLCFNLAPCHEGMLGEWRYSSIHSLTLELDGGEWSASHSILQQIVKNVEEIHSTHISASHRLLKSLFFKP